MLKNSHQKITEQCPCCHSVERKTIGEKNGFYIFLCNNCRTLYTQSVEEIYAAENYDDYYHEGNLTVPDIVNSRLREIVESFEPYRQNNRLLDVGCGAGLLLEAALKNKWQAEGLEISSSSVDSLRKRGIKVFHGVLSEARFPEDRFDVVTAVEILEHIPNPAEIITKIHRILRPGGLFWATTPHGRGASARLLGQKWSCVTPPEHLHLFSVKGLRKIIEKAGFSEVKISTHGVNPFEIFHKWRAGLSSPLAVKTKDENGNEGAAKQFDRVGTGYELNAVLSGSPVRIITKSFLNSILNTTRLGDSLKVWAVK
ncbi:MAG: class I SAM-dependent methyltransferase [Pyrinomonadaceae bacterium]